MTLAKWILGMVQAFDTILMRPGRQHDHLAVHRRAYGQPLGHEAIQYNDQGGAAEDVPVDGFEQPGNQPAGRDLAHGDELIRSKVHRPIGRWDAPNEGYDRRGNA